ncbi:ParA family protein [Photobacterium frigidiphilum]|uniref:ParA family protein n=1 Tax=Photobacterium frigidiphilum TaxID=264736 RepID=A0A2T3J721_9GAMM|nr:ParA family protein [Photobacterium frigidiphilum]PSU44528.1 ParA family protein [Photobacterium frigidiphilum]
MSIAVEFGKLGGSLRSESASLQDVMRVHVSDEDLIEGLDSRIYNHCLNKTELTKLFNLSKPTFNKRLQEAVDNGVIGDPIYQNKTHLYTRHDIHNLKEAWGYKVYSDEYNSKVIGIVNHKGGTGKSTTSALLSTNAALDLDDYANVLLIDMDPQGSQGINLKLKSSENGDEEAVYITIVDFLLAEVEEDNIVRSYLDQGYEFNDLVNAAPVDTHLPNMKVFPAFPDDDRFTDIFSSLDYENKMSLLVAFREKIIPILKNKFDLIIIDTPPQDSPLTWAVLEAIDGLFIPVTPHELDFSSTANYALSLEKRFTELPNKGCNIEWYKFAAVNFNEVSSNDKNVLNKLIRGLKDNLMTAQLAQSELFLEASVKGCTILDLKKSQSVTTAKQFDKAIVSSSAFCSQFMNEIKRIAIKG